MFDVISNTYRLRYQSLGCQAACETHALHGTHCVSSLTLAFLQIDADHCLAASIIDVTDGKWTGISAVLAQESARQGVITKPLTN